MLSTTTSGSRTKKHHYFTSVATFWIGQSLPSALTFTRRKFDTLISIYRPLQAQHGLTDGHFINVHTYSHPYMTGLTSSQVFAELYYTVKAIKDVVGVTPTHWRPPYGDVDDRVRAIATALGLRTVLWSDDTSDWKIQPAGPLPTASIDQNYASIIAEGASPALQTSGILVLTHEINGWTMQEAMKEYPKIVAAFEHVVPYETCLNITMPYQEQSVVYPDFNSYVQNPNNRNPSGIPAASAIKVQSASFSPMTGTSAHAATATSASSAGAAAGSNSVAAEKGSSGNTVAKSSAASPTAITTQIMIITLAALAGGAVTLLC
jgi:peptidoglycan/xylan/chitin deacetylase (PgdA/CDA1 family)